MRFLFMCVLVFVIWACGQQEEKVEYKRVPYKGETPAASGDIAFGHIEDNCISCHASQAPVFKSKADMLKNKAAICKVLDQGSMPPSGPLPDPKVKEIKDDLCG